ncbi:MAG: hypothetical protein KatS3mg060_2270 [Dehalococcoidia bacterium]|nr:MAG: hypothetical protein KatS3mg060_2270 [Dehalococcoidia bacterium]
MPKSLLNGVTREGMPAALAAVTMAFEPAHSALGSTLSLAAVGDPAPILGPDTEVQTGEGGQVTLKATWLGPSAGPVFALVSDVQPEVTADGSPPIGPGTPAVDLAIRDVAGAPERFLRWTLA